MHISDCHYTTLGVSVVPIIEGSTIIVYPIGAKTRNACKQSCTDNPRCQSIQYCDDMGCILKNKVVAPSEASKFKMGCTTYYKQCGKYWTSVIYPLASSKKY